MLDIFESRYFNDYCTRGFIDPQVTLPESLVDEMRAYYKGLPAGRNDYPLYFAQNEHQAALESFAMGLLFKYVPGFASLALRRLYGAAYNKAVHAAQAFLEPVCTHLLNHGMGRIFKTRYLIASYDIYLGNDHKHRSFTDIHSDIPNFHHFYETENDVTIYVPLVDLNEANGGRLPILPEAKAKFKVPGNVLLKLMEDFFGSKAACLDDQGYIDPARIPAREMKRFIESSGYVELMKSYRSSTDLVRAHYADQFERNNWNKGQAVLFTNKNFHAAETWKNPALPREIYMVRLLPVYDCKIRLNGKLHGKPFNRLLIDTREGKVQRFDQAVDVAALPASEKLSLRGTMGQTKGAPVWPVPYGASRDLESHPVQGLGGASMFRGGEDAQA